MKRAKYKPKNINEYRRIKDCTCQVYKCNEPGIIIYRIDTEHGFRYEHRCIDHVHVEKEPKQPSVAAAKNLYSTMVDPSYWLNLSNHYTGKVR